MADGEIILYQAEDGSAEIQLRAQDGTVWLSQAEIADLFQTTPQNVTQHIKGLYEDAELSEAATCKELLQVRLEGSRDVRRSIRLYNLDVILGVGYRVRSPRGSQFRRWATTRLREYLVKGFVIDDARLKSVERFDYFDELLEKIREIRASEKRFYQKVREVYATSADYDGHSDAAQKFFATVQNKMLHAVGSRADCCQSRFVKAEYGPDLLERHSRSEGRYDRREELPFRRRDQRTQSCCDDVSGRCRRSSGTA